MLLTSDVEAPVLARDAREERLDLGLDGVIDAHGDAASRRRR